MELVFDVRNKKDYEILEGLIIFWRKFIRDKRDKRVEGRKSHLIFFFYKIDKNGTIIS